MKYISLFIIANIIAGFAAAQETPATSNTDTINRHKVILDDKSKLLSWYAPQSSAYDQFLRKRWEFIKTKAPMSPEPAPRSDYPQYYFYCAYRPVNGKLFPDAWMNDVGERLPNWFESARLFCAYTGDTSVVNIVRGMADYFLLHGTSPATFAWPDFPYTTANAGDTAFTGFTSANRFEAHEVQVDHAGDMGYTYYRLFQFTGDIKYRDAAIKIANTLASKARTGTAKKSVWPYRVVMNTGKITSEYGANWIGCYSLLKALADANLGKVKEYRSAMEKAKNFLLNFPMKTGYWTDGHTDTDIRSNTYKSNMSASNATLYLLDHPEFDPAWKQHVPQLIEWTEENFIRRSAPGEPSNQWGANIVGEQDTFLFKMDYQTARYAAACARWYALTGDESYKDKAFRSLNWVTYCNDEEGMAFESPLSKGITSWWSDCYGEGPRMFYHALAAVPQWSPTKEDHILYSEGILKDIQYAPGKVAYTAMETIGTEFIRLSFRPQSVSLGGSNIALQSTRTKEGYFLEELGGGDYALILNRKAAGAVVISGEASEGVTEGPGATITVNGSRKFQQIDGIGVNANTRSWNGNELKPALNLLIDSMHANVWRVIVETVEKWEDQNDNDDAFNFNWDYYNKLYETPKFVKAWDMIRYLNNRGITDNLMINFMGPVPEWMGKKTIKPEFEDEYVEMIASFFYYARNTKHLKFGLISPTNESDWRNEGPEINEFQYASVLRKLIDRMDSLKMGDIRYVAPDPASMENGIKRYIPELMKDSVIMSKLAHVGLHSYGGYYANADSALKNSAYPNTDYWITEWNAWRDSLDEGKIGVYNYTFASECVGHLLDLLNHNMTAAMEWEGYDSYYEHHAPSLFSYWGILGYDHENKTYAPRKHFYAIRQVTEYVHPGAYRISVTKNKDSLAVLAFYDDVSKSVSIVGMNTSTEPIQLKGSLEHLPSIASLRMSHTDSIENLFNDGNIALKENSFEATIPARSIFALASNTGVNVFKKNARPEPLGWYAGDIHVHRNCGEGSVLLPEDSIRGLMDENNLDVISVLADMGNGEVKESITDVRKITGKDAPQSTDSRILHWDAEWHWDATYSNFGHTALGGHLVLLGLKEAHQIWDESPYKILEWAGKLDAVKGFAHMEYLNGKVQDELNCCIPIDYPVEAALKTIDFISEDVYGTGSPNNGNYSSEGAMDAYYKLLNCGFRLGLAAGTDYPCNDMEPFGKLLTYVNVKGPLTYDKWIRGIKNGKSVVSRNGHNEFIEMKVNDKYLPGDEIKIKKQNTFSVEVKWSAVNEMRGTIELVHNGKVIATQQGPVAPGKPVVLQTSAEIGQSGWLCARRMDNLGEHLLHTAPIYITVNDKPVRASKTDAEFFVSWIDNILKNIADGGKWSSYFTKDASTVRQRYEKARSIYQEISQQANQ